MLENSSRLNKIFRFLLVEVIKLPTIVETTVCDRISAEDGCANGETNHFLRLS